MAKLRSFPLLESKGGAPAFEVEGDRICQLFIRGNTVKMHSGPQI